MRQYTFHPDCSAATNNMSLRECYLHVIGGPIPNGRAKEAKDREVCQTRHYACWVA